MEEKKTKKKKPILKIILAIVLVLILLVVALVVLYIKGLTADRVTLKANAVTLAVGATEQLEANTADDATVIWKSQDKSVATVDSKGVVTAVGMGKADIIVSAEGHEDAVCKVTVSDGLLFEPLRTPITINEIDIVSQKVTGTREAEQTCAVYADGHLEIGGTFNVNLGALGIDVDLPLTYVCEGTTLKVENGKLAFDKLVNATIDGTAIGSDDFEALTTKSTITTDDATGKTTMIITATVEDGPSAGDYELSKFELTKEQTQTVVDTLGK